MHANHEGTSIARCGVVHICHSVGCWNSIQYSALIVNSSSPFPLPPLDIAPLNSEPKRDLHCCLPHSIMQALALIRPRPHRRAELTELCPLNRESVAFMNETRASEKEEKLAKKSREISFFSFVCSFFFFFVVPLARECVSE